MTLKTVEEMKKDADAFAEAWNDFASGYHQLQGMLQAGAHMAGCLGGSLTSEAKHAPDVRPYLIEQVRPMVPLLRQCLAKIDDDLTGFARAFDRIAADYGNSGTA